MKQLLIVGFILISSTLFAQDEDELTKKNELGIGFLKYSFQLPNLKQQTIQSPFVRYRLNANPDLLKESAWPNIYFTKIINHQFGIRIDINGRSYRDSLYGINGVAGLSKVNYALFEIIPNIQYYIKQDARALAYVYAGIGYTTEIFRATNVVFGAETVATSNGLPWQGGVGYTSFLIKSISMTGQLGFYSRTLKNNTTNQSSGFKQVLPLSRLSINYHF
jgi:hypothetical protein